MNQLPAPIFKREPLTRIAPGHYRNANGEVRNVYSASGAPHVRSARAKWLVSYLGRWGKPESSLVSHLEVARRLLGAD